MRPRGSILEADKRAALLPRRLRPTPPPLAGRCWRDAAASRRLPTRTTSLDISNQRAPTSKSEPSVTVKRHPGPPSTVSLGRPTDSKEPRMTYSAVHNLSRHVIYRLIRRAPSPPGPPGAPAPGARGGAWPHLLDEDDDAD